MSGQPDRSLPRWRRGAVLVALAALAGVLVARSVQLQLLDQGFLLEQANARHLRTATVPAHRGMITDRFGEPLAISSPVDSVWADPGRLLAADQGLGQLAGHLNTPRHELRAALEARRSKEFVYLRRHMTPERADAIMALDLPGVAVQREYRRFYPAGEVAGHVLGFTNIDDVGQEGIELAFDDWLRGESGRKRVVQDRLGRVIEDVEMLKPARPGRDLALSLDRRLQYLAYRALKRATNRHDAKSASLVMLDARTGEVLAMVNQPAFNPNRRSEITAGRYRNRAVTDVFEPGSTLKPFTVAAALESGQYGPGTEVDTGQGYMRVSGNPIRDARAYGVIDVATVIRKSSTVGAAKIALSLEPGRLWGLLGRAGFGQATATGFPGEQGGRLAATPSQRPIERATLAFGYGLSATALQLARAYTALANDGVMVPVTLLRDDAAPAGQRVMSADTARAVRRMMEGVVSPGGTAPKAAIPGYRVAGKTGTAKKSVAGGYAEDRYRALFAGMAPASDPRFVCVVVFDEPQGDEYYGGLVAAPVFQAVMEGALRLYNVAPDSDMSPGADGLMAARGGQP